MSLDAKPARPTEIHEKAEDGGVVSDESIKTFESVTTFYNDNNENYEEKNRLVSIYGGTKVDPGRERVPRWTRSKSAL